MASRKTNRFKHPQTRKIESIAEVFEEKKKVLSQLVEEYKEVSEKDGVVVNRGNEIKIHNDQYWKLLAEINVTKSLEPEIMPNDPSFLFEWIKQNLKKETENLQNTLAQQDEIIEELQQDKKLLRISSNKNSFTVENPSNSENLGDEEIMLELIQRLHKKLATRLRKLVRSNFTSCSDSKPSSNSSASSSEGNNKKNLYRILKEFFAELRNHSNIDMSKKPTVIVDDSYPAEHLQLLIDCDIIEIISQDPLILSLKEA